MQARGWLVGSGWVYWGVDWLWRLLAWRDRVKTVGFVILLPHSGAWHSNAACTEPSPEPREDLLGCSPTLGSRIALGIVLCLFSGDLFWLTVVLQHLTTPHLRAVGVGSGHAPF